MNIRSWKPSCPTTMCKSPARPRGLLLGARERDLVTCRSLAVARERTRPRLTASPAGEACSGFQVLSIAGKQRPRRMVSAVFSCVRGRGLEPPCPCGRYHLKVVRLPISPPARNRHLNRTHQKNNIRPNGVRKSAYSVFASSAAGKDCDVSF